MSDSSPDTADLIAEASQFIFFNYVTIAGAALVFYDYALTFSTEIQEVWSAKFSGAQVLFFLTRYSFMVYTVLFCTINFTENISATWCQVIGYNLEPWSIMPHIALYGILILRTYAIYQKNRIILVILALTGLADVAVTIYSNVLVRPELDGTVFGSTCGQTVVSVFPQLLLASTIVSLILDVLVFTLTFAKTIRHTIEMRKVGLGKGLGYFILRDGAMYFFAKLLIGVVGTTLFFIPASNEIGSWIAVLATITNPLTIVLINRLVLNLRQASHVQEGKTPTIGAIGTIQEPAFAANSFLGNLGAPLRVGQEFDSEDEIEETGIDDEADGVGECGMEDHAEIIEISGDSSDV